MMYKILFRWIVSMASLIPAITNGQSDLYKDVSITSPSPAALLKYADYPVSYHTGNPNISIPIYTASSGQISLPISLNYNASGLKVQEIASWVGTGWSLSAGGVITRTVRGTPDERGTGTVANEKGYMSDKGYSSYVTYSFDGNFVNSNMLQIMRGQLDGEPDIFHFSVAGASGKFFINDDGRVILMPQQDVDISYVYTGSGSISSFTVTVSNGTKYVFGRTDISTDTDPVEITRVASNQTGTAMGNVVSSWYLNKVISQDGLFFIDLMYEPENYSYFGISNPTLAENDVASKDYAYIKSVVAGVRLKTIVFTNGKVEFLANQIRLDLGNSSNFFGNDILNTDAKALNEIQLWDENTVLQKKYVFDYSYFEDNVTNLPVYDISNALQTDKKRLKLLSIQEIARDNNQIPKTLFTYQTDFVPRRLSFSVDHWGYYNGKLNQKMMPTYTKNNYLVVVPGANREPSWPEMRTASLKSITYPTGGNTEFEFEAHRFNGYLPANSEIEIGRVSQGFDGNNIAKEFSASISSGVSFGARVINTSAPLNANAVLTIYKPDNTALAIITAATGGTVLQNFTAPSAGIYRFVLQKQYVSSGNGAEAMAFTNSTGQAYTALMIGGLRIKKIMAKEPIAPQVITTEYEYTDNNVSSGILYGRPSYVHVVRNDELKTFGWYVVSANSTSYNASPNGCLSAETNTGNDNQISFKSAATIRPMEVTQGSHIGYATVTVKKSGNGKTLYRFFGAEPWVVNRADIVNRNLNNGSCDQTVTSFPFIPLEEDYRRGEPKSQWVFGENGTVLSQKTYELEYTKSPNGTPCLIVASASPGGMATPFGGSGGGTTSSACLGSFYHLRTSKKTRSKVIEVINTTNPTPNPLTTEATSFYESPFHAQQTRLLTYDSKGLQKESITKYTSDFQISNIAAINTGEEQYNAASNSAWTTAQITLSGCNTNACKWNALNVYRTTLINARKAYLNTRATNFSNANSTFNTLFSSSYNSASPSLKPVLGLQQKKMLYPVEGREVVNGNVVKSFFNQFQISAEATNRIYPYQLYVLNGSKAVAQFSVSTHDNFQITKDQGYELEATTTYKNGNIAEITGKNGVRTAYLWGFRNVLPIVKAVGPTQSELQNALNANSGVTKTLYQQSTLANSIVTTYDYKPLIGITSQTDPNGRTTTYEYDPFGRLMHLKDHNNNIIKKYCYNYAGQAEQCYGTAYTSAPQSASFTRNNCSAGLVGSTVQFVVPSGQFSSYISLSDANQQAVNYLNANGQAYANANGTCAAPPYTGPCSFSGAPGASIITSNLNSTNSQVNGYLTFSFNQTLQPGTSYKIASIGSSCRPSSPRTFTSFSNGKNYSITVATNGDVNVMLLYGAASVPAYTAVSITSFYYAL